MYTKFWSYFWQVSVRMSIRSKLFFVLKTVFLFKQDDMYIDISKHLHFIYIQTVINQKHLYAMLESNEKTIQKFGFIFIFLIDDKPI